MTDTKAAMDSTSLGGRPPSRIGKKGVTFYLEPSAVKQLRGIGLEEDKSLQALMIEAANMLFKSRKKAEIAK
jgi:hypothetical protein